MAPSTSHLIAGVSGLAAAVVLAAASAAFSGEDPIDAKVRAFLEGSRGSWHDWNVPEADGRILHDLVQKRRFRRALEIGTSTGHSSIWIAWALAKTDGRLTTIEIDPGRHATAVRNFREAGLDGRIDARLGDAHALVRELAGPFDFVFSDADKDRHLQYFKDLEAKVAPGGCFTAHNVRRSGGGGAASFLEYVKARPGWETTVETGSGEGISISCRTP
jgi:caffeoyl-CoA O-methyltransferase